MFKPIIPPNPEDVDYVSKSSVTFPNAATGVSVSKKSVCFVDIYLPPRDIEIMLIIA